MIKMKGYNKKQVKADVPGGFGSNPLQTRTNVNNLTSNKDSQTVPKKKLGVEDFLQMMKSVAPTQGE